VEVIPEHVSAGVMLTIDPVTGDKSQIVIEAAYGLGAAVVNSEVTPDRFDVDKVTLEIRSREVARKSVAYRFDSERPGIRLEPVADSEQAQACLSDDDVVRIAGLGKQIEQAMGAAQDIEWAIGPEREIFLLQTRPETVWSQRSRPSIAAAGSSVMDRILQSMRGARARP
jgi:pyruvate, water dikinase